jgi:hypothetical protein
LHLTKARIVPLARAWTALTGAFALHVWDEAAHDFLAMYNPVAASLRARLGLIVFPPVFTFRTWLTSLLVALMLLLALVPAVRRGGRWVVPAAYLYAAIHIVNGAGHILIAIASGRFAPGVWSAPLLLVSASWLAREASSVSRRRRPSIAAQAS